MKRCFFIKTMLLENNENKLQDASSLLAISYPYTGLVRAFFDPIIPTYTSTVISYFLFTTSLVAAMHKVRGHYEHKQHTWVMQCYVIINKWHNLKVKTVD